MKKKRKKNPTQQRQKLYDRAIMETMKTDMKKSKWKIR